MRLFAMTALALVPTAAFAQASNQNNLEASLKKPAAITNASTSTTSAPSACIIRARSLELPFDMTATKG